MSRVTYLSCFSTNKFVFKAKDAILMRKVSRAYLAVIDKAQEVIILLGHWFQITLLL